PALTFSRAASNSAVTPAPPGAGRFGSRRSTAQSVKPSGWASAVAEVESDEEVAAAAEEDSVLTWPPYTVGITRIATPRQHSTTECQQSGLAGAQQRAQVRRPEAGSRLREA